MKIFAIETSCDETAAAIVEDGRILIASAISSQIEEHSLYGGIVPEIASRRHCDAIANITDICLKKANIKLNEIDAIAVTFAPGLIGSLLVGVNYAKGLSFAMKKPLIAVHHLRAHIAANYITHKNLKPPFMALIISGGHCNIVKVNEYCSFEIIGKTRDDAIGEAYDKVARTLGFSYPGGCKIDKAAKEGNENAYNFPKPLVKNSDYDFSFSGLKTAVLNLINTLKQQNEKIKVNDIAASFQKTICEIVAEKIFKAAQSYSMNKIVVSGGVCCNFGIRKILKLKAKVQNVDVFFPSLELCQDNAAMVASQGYFEFKNGTIASASLNAIASLPIDYY